MTVTAMAGIRENCNSRQLQFSRFIKSSCCPNPNSNHLPFPNPIVTIPKPHSYNKTTIHSLPDDIIYDVLSRVPLTSLPSVSSVCRRWSHLIHSHSFSLLRAIHVTLRPTLFAFSFSNATSFSTLRFPSDVAWNGVVSFSIPGDVSHARVTVVGRKVVIVSRFRCFLFDPWTGSVKSRSGPGFLRKRFAVAAVNGRVYVAGGSAFDSSVEEFNPDANEWRVVSHAPRRRYGCIGVGADGVFYVIGGLKIGSACDTRAGSEARVYASSMDLYDVAGGVWLRSRVVPGGGCVVAACGGREHVYVLASHAVELSFWRFNAKRNNSNTSTKGNAFGEWSRLKSPPLPAQVRLGGTVKFSCVAVEETVVLIQVMRSIGDLLRRNGRNERGNNNNNYKQGLVLIYDCVNQVWKRGPNLPQLLQRPSCVCVDC